MKSKTITRRDFSLLGLLGIGTLAVGGMGTIIWKLSQRRLLFDGEIEGQRVAYYDGAYAMNHSDKMEIYSDGNLSKIIEDYDESEVIGDHHEDKYIIMLDDGRKITYTSQYIIDENGLKIKFYDEIGKKAEEIAKGRLAEATSIYQDMKKKIKANLESRL